MAVRELSALEARVLAVLVEKESTVPDSYPRSLNALTMGCNQKTSRDVQMKASEADVLEALDELKAMHLVRRDGWSSTDHDNIILSRESGARQHEKLCQITHPIGANLAPAFAMLTVSVQRDRAADRRAVLGLGGSC